MSKLLVFIAVLVSNPLNSKTRCVKLPQCLFLWGSSCARSSWKSGRNGRDCWEVFGSLSGSVFHLQSKAVSLRAGLQQFLGTGGSSRSIPSNFLAVWPWHLLFIPTLQQHRGLHFAIPQNLLGAEGSTMVLFLVQFYCFVVSLGNFFTLFLSKLCNIYSSLIVLKLLLLVLLFCWFPDTQVFCPFLSIKIPSHLV